MKSFKELRKIQRRNNKRYLRTKSSKRKRSKSYFKYLTELMISNKGPYTLKYHTLSVFPTGITKEEMLTFSGRPYPEPIVSDRESFIITSGLKDMPKRSNDSTIQGVGLNTI